MCESAANGRPGIGWPVFRTQSLVFRLPVTHALGGGGGGGAWCAPPQSSGAGHLVMITGMEFMPVTIWVVVRTCLVTAGLLPGVPRAGPMVMVAISWSLRG